MDAAGRGAQETQLLPASERAGGLFDAVLPSSIGDSSALLSALSIRNHNPWPSILSFFFRPVRSDQIFLYTTSVTSDRPPFARETSSSSHNPGTVISVCDSAQPFHSKTRRKPQSSLQTRHLSLLRTHTYLTSHTSVHCDDIGEVLSGEAIEKMGQSVSWLSGLIWAKKEIRILILGLVRHNYVL